MLSFSGEESENNNGGKYNEMLLYVLNKVMMKTEWVGEMEAWVGGGEYGEGDDKEKEQGNERVKE